MGTRTAHGKKVLVSGASIAGPTLAYWLHHHGFEVTVVERAGAVRGGGYPIEVRGTAIDVVERMGLVQSLRAAHVNSRRITFLDKGGEPIGALSPEAMTGGVKDRDIEIPRGELTTLLFEVTRERATYRFGDTITELRQRGDGVDVAFASGKNERFDVVIAADGLHSNTRRLVFGSEEPFKRYLGFCFAGFTVPNDLGLSHEAIVYAQPGKAAVLFAAGGDGKTVHAFLNFTYPREPYSDHADEMAQRRLTAEMLQGCGWRTPWMVERMLKADDFFFDSVSQIHMPSWSSGRVVLAGDAAHAPSFLSGQGSSLALVGAYVLAGELATHEHPAAAFAAYERVCRPFVTANQALAAGGSLLLPATAEELEQRNRWLAGVSGSGLSRPVMDEGRKEHSMLVLPEYGAASR